MKLSIIVLLSAVVCAGTAHAQFSRLHVKTSSSSTIGITSGTANKIIGFAHDGSSGTISTTTLNGAAEYSPLKFATSGLVRMTIFENGFVGIGVNGTPTAELTVGGKIHAREMKVNVSAGAGPDYVFAPTYSLMPLSILSAYIKKNNHLPDVPPAVEMEANGIELSTMNMLLLRKVEELTLYLLEQENKMNEMSEKIKVLEQKLCQTK